MPESLLARRLKLGTYLGIGLYVHWSFSLAVVFVALRSLSLGLTGVAFAIAQLFSVFFCVTLHEYGHAMAARCFGIGTADITLLPIGGVARLQRMPRIPWQELVVAVAGPAVNVVIVGVLMVTLAVLADPADIRAMGSFVVAMFTGDLISAESNDTAMQIFTEPSWLGFGILMMLVNTMLVLFNMIPAFPMDGGRVFRSILAMVMDYSRATSIASKVGLVCAGLMAVAALSSEPPNPIPVLIAAFIGYAGIAEARQVNLMEKVRGLRVSDVMIESDRALSMDTPLDEIARQWRKTSQPTLPIVSIVGTVVGTLRLEDVAAAIAAGQPPETTAGQLVDHRHGIEVLGVDELLSSALSRPSKTHRQIPVVDSQHHLVGILDLETMLSRRGLPSPTAVPATEPSIDGAVPRFDATN
ncbi:Putative zinc metalloprotease Rip3 [Rubripirellula lacrimiformis]|uniref:Zinc metalloprotease n=1 Tax=Rubripirellula lacrimiformis TaxID=1930273 RepID=A0A517NKL3_9BACT|nr:site-2 protease family protein [Rubripirellula lacrimiformis]QDT07619.1 Putative zinc metalloprotease Rip3 [Rubripirellula lacrimiformis]